MESYRGPGAAGVILGLIVVLGLGGLTVAVWDGRFNGDNATALRELVDTQQGEIQSLENEIANTKSDILLFTRKKAVASKLENLQKVVAATISRRDELRATVAKYQDEIATIGEEQDAYRQKYREFERARAIGETYETLVLTNGKILRNVKLRRIKPMKVSFATEYGTATATWDELPPEWKMRFQIGSGEIEAHREALQKANLERALVMEGNREKKMDELKAMDKRQRIYLLTREIKNMASNCQSAEGKIANLKTQERLYLSRAGRASSAGAARTHRNSATRVKVEIKDLKTKIRVGRKRIVEMRSELAALERSF